MKRIGISLGLVLLASAGWAATKSKPDDGLTVWHGHLEQAGYLAGMVPPGSKVTLDGTPVWVGSKGQMMVAFDRMAKPEAKLKICAPHKPCVTRVLDITQRDYVTQNVTKIPPQTVNPDPKELAMMQADTKAINAARDAALRHAGDREDFMHLLTLPVHGPTSGVFGSRRTYNGEERSWHRGHDLAVPVGTPVRAPAAATVRLARPTFMSGNLIMLDHGGGMTTVYAHLSKMLVKVGDKVKAGDVIGLVGVTGRSNGPHLHWGTYWKSMAIDPMLWVKP